jgi:Cft2 family RNA processing exonuclease
LPHEVKDSILIVFDNKERGLLLMNITILGGGNEIGASCLHVEINGTRLLIDAGMRMHQDDPLPALGMLEELGGVDAILVTHAHADHIGALPVAAAMYPDARVYATPPTMDLMRVMMQDSYRILEARCKQEQRLIPYTEQQMGNFLNSVLAFPARGRLAVGGVEVTAYRAGHILGAVMYGISGGGERLLVTGDISFRAGRTIPGVKVPYDFKPDVVVMESTYGNRIHTDRNAEEKRLADHVAEVVAGGGFALIPAFALGRSQEVLLILQDYMEKGLIPSFPIYVDGMVTPICRIYRGYPQYLKGPVAHRIRQNEDAFLNEERCIAVRDVKHREQILQGKPGCIVASSGMLIGGASLWYAEKLIQDEKNAIFITGYQDEESPGRKLLALAEGSDRTLEIKGVTHQVRCRVDKYGLSAHADAMEMVRFIEELNPGHTLLVHGDDDARFRLAERIDSRFGPILTENDNPYRFDPSKTGKVRRNGNARYSQQQTSLDQWTGHLLLLRDDKQLLYPAICLGIHAKTRTLVCQTLHKKTSIKITPGEIVETLGVWDRSILDIEEPLLSVARYSRPLLEQIDWMLLEEGRNYTLEDACTALGMLEPDQKLATALALQALPETNIYHVNRDGFALPFYIVDKQAIAALRDLQLPVQGIRMDTAAALDIAREQLQDHPRFIRCGGEGLNSSDPGIIIYFDFPDAVGAEERNEIAASISVQTGWHVRFSDSVRQDQMVQLVRTMLGSVLAGSNPSIHQHDKKVIVNISPPGNWNKIQKQFSDLTGYNLQLKKDKSHSPTPAPAPSREADHALPANRQPMKLNEAMQEVRRWAEEISAVIYKAGVHQGANGPYMELHFISPQVAERYSAAMEQLADRVGMPVSYTRNPKQNEILAVTKEWIPLSWGVMKNPSIHTDKLTISVKLPSDTTINESELEKIKAAILEITGYELEIRE